MFITQNKGYTTKGHTVEFRRERTPNNFNDYIITYLPMSFCVCYSKKKLDFVHINQINMFYDIKTHHVSEPD